MSLFLIPAMNESTNFTVTLTGLNIFYYLFVPDLRGKICAFWFIFLWILVTLHTLPLLSLLDVWNAWSGPSLLTSQISSPQPQHQHHFLNEARLLVLSSSLSPLLSLIPLFYFCHCTYHCIKVSWPFNKPFLLSVSPSWNYNFTSMRRPYLSHLPDRKIVPSTL